MPLSKIYVRLKNLVEFSRNRFRGKRTDTIIKKYEYFAIEIMILKAIDKI